MLGDGWKNKIKGRLGEIIKATKSSNILKDSRKKTR